MTAHRERQYSWIGGVKRDDDWMWQLDNVQFPIEYFGWAAGQPDHLWMGTHNCLAIFGSDSDPLLSGNIQEPWKWDNSECSHRKYCICEKNVYRNVTESSPESASLTNDLPFQPQRVNCKNYPRGLTLDFNANLEINPSFQHQHRN